MHNGVAASAADDIAELAITSLPLDMRFRPFHLRQYGGFWLLEEFLVVVLAVHSVFEPRPSDVLLASFPKCGTTWLKAIAFSTRNRAEHPPSVDAFAVLRSPRVVATHLPYSLLPWRISAEESGCRIVYICVSALPTGGAPGPRAEAAQQNRPKRERRPCHKGGRRCTSSSPSPSRRGHGHAAAAAVHIRGGVRAVLQRIMRERPTVAPRGGLQGHEQEAVREGALPPRLYSMAVGDALSNVNKLAEFMGCPFSGEEEAVGVVQAINMEVNKSGSQGPAAHESFFRKGVVGDWSNHMTLAMAERLDRIAEDALQGSGFSFAVAGSSS
ncbi:hypothetical protein VPH35_104251 [Triticum aestivum]